jgi:hypothetical protein
VWGAATGGQVGSTIQESISINPPYGRYMTKLAPPIHYRGHKLLDNFTGKRDLY